MIPTHSSPSANRAAKSKAAVIIKGHTSYKDGGTVKLFTNRGTFYLDGRLGSKTKGKLFTGYPGKEGAARVIDERIIRSVNEQYEV